FGLCNRTGAALSVHHRAADRCAGSELRLPKHTSTISRYSLSSFDWIPAAECAKTPPTMQRAGWRCWFSWSHASRKCAIAASCALWLAVAACSDVAIRVAQPQTGMVGGRVLVAPGASLVGAHVVVDQVNLYDGKADLRKHVGESVTDD